MHDYYGAVPAWSSAFLPYLVGKQYPFQHGMEPPTPHINTSSTTSNYKGTEDNRSDGGEIEAPCTSHRVEESTKDKRNIQEIEDGSAGTSQNVVMDDDDMVEEPKLEMEFNSLENLLSYYKQYGKKCSFGVMMKRTERGEDETIRYVTIACARGGKAQNRT
ncbi:hypothetical protein I3843_12G117700 [Carya illinoinensis]|nr:hypothetical protein I3843_12G117700 [Carya illinoinensis]